MGLGAEVVVEVVASAPPICKLSTPHLSWGWVWGCPTTISLTSEHSVSDDKPSESEDEETRELAALRTLDLELTMDLDKMAAEGHSCVRFFRACAVVWTRARRRAL